MTKRILFLNRFENRNFMTTYIILIKLLILHIGGTFSAHNSEEFLKYLEDTSQQHQQQSEESSTPLAGKLTVMPPDWFTPWTR